MEEKVREIINNIVRIVDPDIILLFGSRATGNMNEDSDLDLLVIKSDLKDSRRLMKEVYASLSGIGIPVDIIIVDKKRMNDHLNDPYMIYGEAVREGKTLYAKA